MWIIIGFASLAVLVFLILCVPLDFIVEFDTHESPKSRKRFIWLFGMIRKDLGDTTIKRKKEQKKEEKKKRPEGGERIKFIFRILKTRGLVKQFTRFIQEIITRLQVQYLRANITLGFENPADTGVLFAWLYPANYLLHNFAFYKVNLQPSFAGDLVFEGSFHSCVRVKPIRFTAPFVKLLFSAAVLRVIGVIIRDKWKKR